MTRVSDTLKLKRSYVVFYSPTEGYFVKASHWLPGYTDAHKETPEEAIDFTISQKEKEIENLKKAVDSLQRLKDEC